MRKFYVRTHMGLGDMILCNGLVRNICKKFGFGFVLALYSPWVSGHVDDGYGGKQGPVSDDLGDVHGRFADGVQDSFGESQSESDGVEEPKSVVLSGSGDSCQG